MRTLTAAVLAVMLLPLVGNDVIAAAPSQPFDGVWNGNDVPLPGCSHFDISIEMRNGRITGGYMRNDKNVTTRIMIGSITPSGEMVDFKLGTRELPGEFKFDAAKGTFEGTVTTPSLSTTCKTRRVQGTRSN